MTFQYVSFTAMESSTEFLQLYLDRLLRALQAGENPVWNRGEAIISFDGNYRAFIPTNKGFNHKEDRLYMRDCKFTKDLSLSVHGERIHRNEISGGRVFVNHKGSFIKSRDGKLIKVSDLAVQFPN